MRYLPLTHGDRRAMLEKIGVGSVDALFRDVPAAARDAAFDLPRHAGEIDVDAGLRNRQLANESDGRIVTVDGHRV